MQVHRVIRAPLVGKVHLVEHNSGQGHIQKCHCHYSCSVPTAGLIANSHWSATVKG